ncbi:MAG: ester cyclase [Rhodospirillaceae bacterium]|nr:ester cyclase [Rhodospirillaceae bacterium]
MKYALLAATALVLSAGANAAEPTVVGCAPDNPNYVAYMGMTNEMFIPRNGEVAPKFYHNEFYSHNQDRGGGTKMKVTVENMKKVYEESYKTFGERSYENELILCAGDYVVARTVLTSKMTGPMGGQAATNRTARISATDIYKFQNGKVIERWGNADNIGQLWQLGLQLPPAPPGMAPKD